jgi:hypothetical protein
MVFACFLEGRSVATPLASTPAAPQAFRRV